MAVLATGLSAQDLGAWDADSDGILSRDEFRAGIDTSDTFGEWGADGNAALDSDELLEGIYGLWDADGDARLTVEEWDDSVDRWFGEDAVNLSVGNWDADGDGVISPFEFMRAQENTNLLERVGLDAESDVLTEEDFTDGLFGIADADGDAFLGEEEDIWLTDLLELLNPVEDVDVQDEVELSSAEQDVDVFEDTGSPDLLQDGEAFSHLPIPCGTSGQTCSEVAERFCAALDYDPPLDFLEVDGSLYVVRCADSF